MATIKLKVDEFASSAKKAGGAVKNTTKSMSGMSQVAGGLKTQMAGLVTVFAGAQGVQLIGDSFANSAAKAMELSDAMTPLVALGDNASNFRAISDEIHTLRQVFGATAAEASELTFNIQSGGAALDKTTKEGIKQMSLLANKVAGFDLGGISKAALKTFNIFGKEAGTVTDVFNKFVITASDADASINDLAGSIPELLAAAKGVGGTFEEALSSIIALTPSAGSASVAITQLRNMFVRLKSAQVDGTLTATNFKDQLVELSKLDTAAQLKTMGLEGFGAFQALTGATEIFEQSMVKLGTNTENEIITRGCGRGLCHISEVGKVPTGKRRSGSRPRGGKSSDTRAVICGAVYERPYLNPSKSWAGSSCNGRGYRRSKSWRRRIW